MIQLHLGRGGSQTSGGLGGTYQGDNFGEMGSLGNGGDAALSTCGGGGISKVMNFN